MSATSIPNVDTNSYICVPTGERIKIESIDKRAVGRYSCYLNYLLLLWVVFMVLMIIIVVIKLKSMVEIGCTLYGSRVEIMFFFLLKSVNVGVDLTPLLLK